MEGKLKFLRYVAYGLEILILYILCGIPGFLPSFLSIKPLILLPVALTIAVFENEIPAMIIGLVCGMLLDIGASTSIGFYTVSLTVLCFFLGYCQRNFFVTNFVNATVIGLGSIFGLLLINFLIFGVFKGTPDLGPYFLQYTLLRFVYTAIFLPPLFWFNGLFRSSMKE